MISIPCDIINYAMPCHHIFHIIIYAMPCHYISYHHPCHVITTFVFHWVCTAIISLVIPLSLLNSFDINHDPCNGSFVFYRFHPATVSIGYSFIIREILWHQWQLYSQHYPPLTTMTKDNLLCHCCTHFDIGFPVFLFSSNCPYQHISSFKLFSSLTFLTGFGSNHWLSNYSLS